jgi:hypothetical protein
VASHFRHQSRPREIPRNADRRRVAEAAARSRVDELQPIDRRANMGMIGYAWPGTLHFASKRELKTIRYSLGTLKKAS